MKARPIDLVVGTTANKATSPGRPEHLGVFFAWYATGEGPADPSQKPQKVPLWGVNCGGSPKVEFSSGFVY